MLAIDRSPAIRLVSESWTIEATRRFVEPLKDIPRPPAWVDAPALAVAIVAGEVKRTDPARFERIVEETAAPALSRRHRRRGS